MRRGFTLVPVLLTTLPLAAGAPAQEPAEVPAHNVRLTDASGLTTRLVAFYRLSGEAFFRGFLGAADIEVPYARLTEIRIAQPDRPGGRRRAALRLRSDREVAATFDSREGRELFRGLASFGQVQIAFHDIRRLEFLGPTTREDLPDFGAPDVGLNVRLVDREGVQTELAFFRRSVGRNVLAGRRGTANIEIPFRIVQWVKVSERTPARGAARAEVRLRNGTDLTFRLSGVEEGLIFRGEADFGLLRIRFGDVRRIEVQGVTAVPRLAERASPGPDPDEEADAPASDPS